ncbi:Hypothetical predicted protein [Pelobates cultripes]|uniref:Uncharacterized protein n=1 Tax=Pelobates cultripes TaxID=61616 RepID=A0AAD1RA91_PELCU|nr:Hypothetical predicted protein [Pelobates cultripes]
MRKYWTRGEVCYKSFSPSERCTSSSLDEAYSGGEQGRRPLPRYPAQWHPARLPQLSTPAPVPPSLGRPTPCVPHRNRDLQAPTYRQNAAQDTSKNKMVAAMEPPTCLAPSAPGGIQSPQIRGRPYIPASGSLNAGNTATHHININLTKVTVVPGSTLGKEVGEDASRHRSN